jgi:hypothetical protein
MVCLGLGGRKKHMHTTDKLFLQDRTSAGGAAAPLASTPPSAESETGLGRRHGRRISTSKEPVSTAPGPSSPGSPPRTRPKQMAEPVAPQPQPAVPLGHRPGSWPRQPDSRVGPTSGRPSQAPAAAATPPRPGKSPAPGPTKSSFRANSASVHADIATSDTSLITFCDK